MSTVYRGDNVPKITLVLRGRWFADRVLKRSCFDGSQCIRTKPDDSNGYVEHRLQYESIEDLVSRRPIVSVISFLDCVVNGIPD
jgi:hypothetical protein